MSIQITQSYNRDSKETIPAYHAIELTKGGNLATINLDEQVYVLRITRMGKLILTK